jgi:hypothetical protein
MCEPALEEFGRFDAAKKSLFVYGKRSLETDFPEEMPVSGAWSVTSVSGYTGVTVPYGIIFPQERQTAAVNSEHMKIHTVVSFVGPNPFTQPNLIDTEEGQILELIARTRTSVSIPHREKLAKMLITLYIDAKEEEETNAGISLGSLRSFYNFLRSHNFLKPPMISLTDDGNIYASWKPSPDRVFSVHYLPNDEVRFVVFAPNERYPEKPIRISGIATIDILVKLVETYGVLGWASE